ncbi:phytase [Gynuella sp.]|uniref:phytase n=1 Tax=Gynuella sp. TaxID=2969146 RepID=UPI003D0AA0D3
MNISLLVRCILVTCLISAPVSFTLAADGLSTVLKSSHSFEDIADSAYWRAADGRAEGYLIASLEGDGLAVFNQTGALVQRDERFEVLGADVRYGFRPRMQYPAMDIVAVGLPEQHAFGFYRVAPDPSAPLQFLGQINTDSTVEGVCLYQNVTTGEVIVTGFTEEGSIVQYKLDYDGQHIISRVRDDKGVPIPVRVTPVGGKLSSCVADDETATLFIAEQNVGIWSYGADAENVKDRYLIDVALPLGHIEEIENMDLVYQPDGKGLLVVADEGQGFLVYDRQNSHKFLGGFNVTGFEEAKLVTAAADGLWLGNTEADQPVYEKLPYARLAFLSDVRINTAMDLRHMSVDGVSLVAASGETQAVDDDGDAADDPAIWVNEQNPQRSLIIATNKQGGLMAYDLSGREIQYLEGGRPNNVDIRQRVKTPDGGSISLAAASNRELNTIVLYTIQDTEAPIKKLPIQGDHTHSDAAELISRVDEVYGLCMGQTKDGRTYVFVNGKDGQIEQWRISLNEDSARATLVRTMKVNSQPEGCVVDDQTQTLYIGEEDQAIWSFDAHEEGGTQATLVASVDGRTLVDDIEGLAIYSKGEKRYLLASSQGNNTYAVYDLVQNNRYVGSFAITGNDEIGVDGTSDTDGIDIISTDLGTEYPDGIMVAQDWYNVNKRYELENQNFKLVSWQAIAEVLFK